jgi:hypothetical protein
MWLRTVRSMRRSASLSNSCVGPPAVMDLAAARSSTCVRVSASVKEGQKDLSEEELRHTFEGWGSGLVDNSSAHVTAFARNWRV